MIDKNCIPQQSSSREWPTHAMKFTESTSPRNLWRLDIGKSHTNTPWRIYICVYVIYIYIGVKHIAVNIPIIRSIIYRYRGITWEINGSRDFTIGALRMITSHNWCRNRCENRAKNDENFSSPRTSILISLSKVFICKPYTHKCT